MAFLPFLIVFLSVGVSSETHQAPASKDFAFPYDLAAPDQSNALPAILREISGLSLDETEQYLLAIQDEDGIIFYIDVASGKVEKEVEFWKDGDYEGIESAHGKIYVIKSTGTVYEVSSPGIEKQTVNKYNSFLNSDNDVEGLGFDRQYNRLLLACKAKAGNGETFPYQKAIYSFNLNGNILEEEPVYLISLDKIHNYLETDPAIRKLDKIIDFFSSGDSSFSFSPSALSIHPISGHIYVLSSVGKLLVVINRRGDVLHIEKLKKSVHAQPEGMCFDQRGSLFIANEGKGDDAFIYRFNYLRR